MQYIKTSNINSNKVIVPRFLRKNLNETIMKKFFLVDEQNELNKIKIQIIAVEILPIHNYNETLDTLCTNAKYTSQSNHKVDRSNLSKDYNLDKEVTIATFRKIF